MSPTAAGDILVVLPGSTVLDGRRVTAARIVGLDGHDEMAVAEANHATPLDAASALLHRCVTSIGMADGGELPATAVDRLSLGDRQALLLHLRRTTFGEQLDLVAHCPDPTCGQPMDLALTVGALLLSPAADDAVASEHERRVNGALVRFRLPTAVDVAGVASIALDAPDAAALELARRCVIVVDGPQPSDDYLVALIESAAAELDPQAQIHLALTCPECARSFTTSVDAGQLLLDELAAHRANLENAVHLLARSYHWSEADILALPIRRRRRYVSLLVDALAADDSRAWT